MIRNFGNKLKQLRNSKKITQKELASRLGISKSIVASYETDVRYPSLEVLIMISKEFGVTTDYLLGIEKARPIYLESLDDEQIFVINKLIDEFKKANNK